MLNIIGIDQSLSKVGASTIEIDNEYAEKLKNYILILKSFLDVFSKKSTNLKKLTEKSKLKKFDFLDFLKGCKYTIKDLNELELIYKDLLTLQKEIVENDKFNEYKEIFNTIKNSKNITFNKKYSGELLVSKKVSIERLSEYKDMYINYINDNKPYLIAMEGYSYDSTNTRSVFDLGELGGMIKLENFAKKYNTVIVTPSSLKMFISNDGKADKVKMIASIEKLFNIKFELVKKNKEIEKLDDVYDAFSLSLFCILIPFMNITDSLKCKII